LWLKPGAGVDDFNKDKYVCLQQSQQRTSSLYVNRYGGFGSSDVITNGGLYGACMNAHGWYLTPVSDPKAYNTEVAAAMAPIMQSCTNAEYQVLFSRKMACKAAETTQEQTQERSKISSAERAAFEKWLALLIDTNEKIAAIQRKYNPKSGEALASNIERGMSEVKVLASEFTAGKLSWGEYNKARMNAAKRSEETAKYALTN
jgi:hypothetical protein